jgi:hypothetical protein
MAQIAPSSALKISNLNTKRELLLLGFGFKKSQTILVFDFGGRYSR